MKQAIVYGIARSGHNWMSNVVKSWLGSDYQVYDMESIWPWEFEEIFCRDFQFETYPEWPIFILTRDYLNWAASWFKMIKGGERDMRDPERVMIWADRWMAIYEEALNATNHIPNKVTIHYDTFIQDRNYRMDICNLMGGTYNEGILNFVPGQGSSFDSQETHQGRGREMKVLERWKWFLTDQGEQYHHHLSLRPNVMEYYLDHFDVPEDKMQFIESLTLINT